MKKVLTIMLLVLSVIFCGNFNNISVHAMENDGFDIDYTFMTENDFEEDFEPFETNEPGATGFGMVSYFQNLDTYSPTNSQGSCGYVSFIQYLSYYDTFRNDTIIPEAYERNQGNVTNMLDAISVSPGVLKQYYPSNNLYNHIQNNKDDDFQMHLMDIVNLSFGRSSSAYSYSIGMWDYYRILNGLFTSTNVSFSYTRVKDFGQSAKPTDENVISWFDTYVKDQLDLGNPVMLHIAKYDETTNKYRSYHSVVAYYYDENGIHAHFGWGSNSTDVVIDSSYQITEAGIMSLANIPLTHSNNYTINNVHYCGCGNQYYSHTHNYSSWVYYNQSSHIQTCICGQHGTVTRAHAINASDVGNRFIRCIECNYLLDMNKDMAFVVYNSSLVELVSINGSYILPNGIIVLVEEDIDAYMSGELIFYDKDQVPQLG